MSDPTTDLFPPDDPDPRQTRGNPPLPVDGEQDVTQDPADVPDDYSPPWPPGADPATLPAARAGAGEL